MERNFKRTRLEFRYRLLHHPLHRRGHQKVIFVSLNSNSKPPFGAAFFCRHPRFDSVPCAPGIFQRGGIHPFFPARCIFLLSRPLSDGCPPPRPRTVPSGRADPHRFRLPVVDCRLCPFPALRTLRLPFSPPALLLSLAIFPESRVTSPFSAAPSCKTADSVLQ